MDRGLIRWVLVVAALVFGALWFMSAVASGFTVPDWVPPAGFLCLAVAVALPLFTGDGAVSAGVAVFLAGSASGSEVAVRVEAAHDLAGEVERADDFSCPVRGFVYVSGELRGVHEMGELFFHISILPLTYHAVCAMVGVALEWPPGLSPCPGCKRHRPFPARGRYDVRELGYAGGTPAPLNRAGVPLFFPWPLFPPRGRVWPGTPRTPFTGFGGLLAERLTARPHPPLYSMRRQGGRVEG